MAPQDAFSWPNPPPGMSRATERFWNHRGEDGWGPGGGSNRYVSDPAAPVDAPTVLEMPFGPCNDCGSSSMGNQVVKRFDVSGGELWIESWHKWSANWALNPSQSSKLMYIFDVGQINSPTYLVARSTNSDPYAPMRIALSLQGQDNTDCGLRESHTVWSNSAGALPRDQWIRLTTYLRHNSPGQCDAAVQVWVNGRLAIDAAGFRFRDPTYEGRLAWAGINFNPVWGGGRADLPGEQTLRTAYLVALTR